MTTNLRLGGFATAQAMREIVRQVVREESDLQRPRPRYATVESIDRERRSCMVRYTGEDEAVRVPYNGLGPANVGQEVRIDGPPSDRVIVDVRGTSDSEARVHETEVGLSRRAAAMGRWSLASNWSMPQGSWGVMPIARWEVPGGFPPFGGIEATPGGEITVSESGYYRVAYKAVVAGPFGRQRRSTGLWVQPPGQGASQVGEIFAESTTDSAEYIGVYDVLYRITTFSESEHLYLEGGSKITVRGNSGSSSDSTVYGSAERMITGVNIRSTLLGPQEEDLDEE